MEELFAGEDDSSLSREELSAAKELLELCQSMMESIRERARENDEDQSPDEPLPTRVINGILDRANAAAMMSADDQE